MKNTIYTICILTFLSFANAIGQKPVIELNFTATSEGQTVILDSINIENLTQGGDTTLYAPNNVLVLDYTTGIGGNNENGANQFFVSQNYPNPFDGQTSVNLKVPEKELIKISIYDLMGREVANYNNTLDAGNHSFTFYAGKEKYYLLTATGSNVNQSIKMINFSNNETNALLVYQGSDESLSFLKSQKAVNDFIFSPGDQLRFIGYAATVAGISGSDVREDAPQSSTDYDYPFAIIEGLPCPGIPSLSYEGQTYKTVQIANQCWFKENLNVGAQINTSEDQMDNNVIEKYCNNCNLYGGLYQWNEMMQYTTQQGTQGICPSGWHIPTDQEWCILTQYIDPTVNCDITGWSGTDVGMKMKSTNFWNWNPGNIVGTNSSGFTARPGGWCEFGNLDGMGEDGLFWSSTEYNGSNAWRRNLLYDFHKVGRGPGTMITGYSVRCLKD